MKLYRFSPIKDQEQLLKAIEYTHFACHKLCKQSLNEYLPNAGNIGIFCHYQDEYDRLIVIQKELCDMSESIHQKYFKLYKPFVIRAKDGVSKTAYNYLYIRKPDPYRHQVGDIDFVVEADIYIKLKQSLANGKQIKGARIFPRGVPDMIELYDSDIDALGYVCTNNFVK